MALEILATVVIAGIALIIIMVYVTGRWKQSDEPDTGTALLEFGRTFPEEAIRSVVTTSDGMTSFFRLASGRTGLLQALGNHNVVRLIEPGSIVVHPVEDRPALQIDFREAALPGGVYSFESGEDAAEVSLWLCGTFALAAADDRSQADAPTPREKGRDEP